MGTNGLGFTTPDYMITGLIALFCILGFAKGAIRQFFSILAFVIATVASVVIPYFVNLPVIEGASPVWGYIILSILIWVPTFLVANSIGKFLSKRMTKKGINFSSRLWGFLFGGIKGLIIVIIIIFLIDLVPSNVKESIPWVPELYRESRVVSIIQPFNPLVKIHIMENLQLILSALEDPDYMEILTRDPGFQKLRQNETIKEILNDPELRKILQEHQYIKFITHPTIRALIKDQDAMRLLLTTDIDKVVISNL